MKLLKKIVPFLFLLFLLAIVMGCATTKPVFPWPDFKIVDVGDMLCAPDIENKVKFDQWLEDIDTYRAEVEK